MKSNFALNIKTDCELRISKERSFQSLIVDGTKDSQYLTVLQRKYEKLPSDLKKNCDISLCMCGNNSVMYMGVSMLAIL